MAKIIWPEKMGLQIVERDHCVTDEKRGLEAEITARPTRQPLFNPAQPVVSITIFDWKSADVWSKTQEITMQQAKELGQWLCQRAREYEQAERRTTWRQWFSRLKPRR